MTTYSIKVNGGAPITQSGPISGFPGYFVFFRPDEIIFHNGDATTPGFVNKLIGPHTVEVFKDGIIEKTYNLCDPAGPLTTARVMQTYARWAHIINPDTIERDAAAILALNCVIPIKQIGAFASPKTTNKWDGPLANGGVALYMGGTGQRNDIGLYAEWDAEALATNNFSSCLEAAKGLWAVPIYIRDERDGTLFNKLKYPKASAYGNQNQTGAAHINSPAPTSTLDPTTRSTLFVFDWAHQPCAAFIAGLATKKHRYLEICQAFANYSLLWSWFRAGPAAPGTQFPYAAINIGQTRGTAWSWRALLVAWIMTKIFEHDGPLPDYLFPSSYFDQLIKNSLDYFTKCFMDDQVLQKFRQYPMLGTMSPFETDFLHKALGAGCQFRKDIVPLYLWGLKNTMDRASGKTPWPAANPSSYYLGLGPLFKMGDSGTPLGMNPADFFTDWGQVINRVYNDVGTPNALSHMTAAEATALKNDPFNGGQFTPTDMYYNFDVHSTLAIAVNLDRSGEVDVSGTFPELEATFALQDAMLQKVVAGGRAIPWRESFSPNPTGGISLPTSVTINVGQTVHLALQVNGAIASGPTYTSSDATVGVPTPDPNPLTGVSVKGLKGGTATITGDAVGAGPLTTTCVVTVNPLATTMALIPGTIT